MIYARKSDGGILIGLSKGNLELLQQGKPILKRHPGMPPLRIVYGETEETIFTMLTAEGVIDAATTIRTYDEGGKA
jgi:hypothetical protein